MQPDLRFSDSETDEALRLPSRRVIVALTVFSLFMLLASLSYGQGVMPPQRSSAAGSTGSVELVTGTLHRVNRLTVSQ